MQAILNTKHLIFVICSLCIVTLKTFPPLFIRTGGRDVWIAAIAASVLILFFVWLITSAMRKTETYKLHEIYRGTLGNFGGGILYVFFMITVLLTLFESAGAEANVMKEGFMIDTPVFVFIAVSSFCALYIAKKGAASVMIVTVISIICISLSGMLLAALTQSDKEIKYLYPMLENGLNGDFFITVFKIVGAFSCLSIFIPFIDSVANKKKLTKHTLIGVIFVCQIIVFSMIGVITTFGPERAVNLVYPKLTQTQIISVFDFIEAGELFVMLQIVGGWFIRFVVCLFALSELMRLAGAGFKYMEYFLVALTLVFSYLFACNMFDMFKLMDYLLYIQLINFFAIPLLLHSLYYFKYKKTKRPAGTAQE